MEFFISEFWYSWRYQLKEFSKDYWTIAIDQRGYGESDKPGNISDYHINKMSDDIHALVKSLGKLNNCKLIVACAIISSILSYRTYAN